MPQAGFGFEDFGKKPSSPPPPLHGGANWRQWGTKCRGGGMETEHLWRTQSPRGNCLSQHGSARRAQGLQTKQVGPGRPGSCSAPGWLFCGTFHSLQLFCLFFSFLLLFPYLSHQALSSVRAGTLFFAFQFVSPEPSTVPDVLIA